MWFDRDVQLCVYVCRNWFESWLIRLCWLWTLWLRTNHSDCDWNTESYGDGTSDSRGGVCISNCRIDVLIQFSRCTFIPINELLACCEKVFFFCSIFECIRTLCAIWNWNSMNCYIYIFKYMTWTITTNVLRLYKWLSVRDHFSLSVCYCSKTYYVAVVVHCRLCCDCSEYNVLRKSYFCDPFMCSTE